MSWMITDVRVLKGTCYMEVLPGRFVGKSWNPESVYFEEAHFGFIEPAIARHVRDYDHYAFLDVEKSLWELIIADLQSLRQKLVNRSSLAEVRNDVNFFFTTTQKEFLQDESSLTKLRGMLDDFLEWLQSTLQKHQIIAVLGM